MSGTPLFGRLEPVELRKGWISEAQSFTPWLAEDENIELLGQAIGINLVVEAIEKPVGDFRADIICREAETSRLVLIENQVEPSDHRHLGQILTYAAGSETAVVIWIVSRLRPEHRAAIDWLNRITRDDFFFFGIEIELWRIGTSPPAPRFNVVVEPNEWQRAVAKRVERTRSGEPEGIDINRVAYWEAFEEAIERKSGDLKPRGRPPRTGAYSFTLARDVYLWAFRDVAKREIGVYLGLYGVGATERFELLSSERQAIENEIGEPLLWREKKAGSVYQIMLRRPNANALNESDWPDQLDWLIDRLERFRAALFPRLERIQDEVGRLP